jgi:hypothetical protein
MTSGKESPPAMTVDLRSVVVRVLDLQGVTAGTGFLVDDEGLLVTCAHVVDLAGSGPGGTVAVAFLGDEPRPASVEAEYWRPPEAEDVAFLRLDGPPPEGARSLPLGSATGARGEAFRAYGFPKGKPTQGLSGYGEIGDPLRVRDDNRFQRRAGRRRHRRAGADRRDGHLDHAAR